MSNLTAADGGILTSPNKSPISKGDAPSKLKKRLSKTDKRLSKQEIEIKKLIDELTIIKTKSDISLESLNSSLKSLKNEQTEQKQIVVYALYIITVTVATMLLTAFGIVIDYLFND